MDSLTKTQGCLLGLALGDAFGAPHEGGFLERSVWRLIGRTRSGERRWTDDTQMTVDVVESFLATGTTDPDDLARRFAASYRWSRGYGPGAARVLKQIGRGKHWSEANRSVYPNGSFGNGAAMRAPLIGLIYSGRPAELHEAVRMSSVVTHAHPLAIEGALLIATTTTLMFQGEANDAVLRGAWSSLTREELTGRLEMVQRWIEKATSVSPAEVVRGLGSGIAASDSCVTALYLALRFRDREFDDMIVFAASCGGDVDTIGAMAGGLWGAANGRDRLPENWLRRLEQRNRLLELGARLHQQIAIHA